MSGAVVVIDGNADGAAEAANQAAAGLRGAAGAAKVADTAFVAAANSADDLSLKAVGLDSAMSIVSRGANFARESIEAMFRGSAEGAAAWDAIEMKGRAVYGVFGEILLGTEDVGEAGEVMIEVLDDAVEVLRLLGAVVQPVATVLRVTLGGALSVAADVARVFRGEARGATDDIEGMGDAAETTANQLDALTTTTNAVFGRTARGQAEEAADAVAEYERAVSRAHAVWVLSGEFPSIFEQAQNDPAIAAELDRNIESLAVTIQAGARENVVYFESLDGGARTFQATLRAGQEYASFQQIINDETVVGIEAITAYNQLVSEQQAAEETYLESIAPAREAATETTRDATTSVHELTTEELKLAATVQTTTVAFMNAMAAKRSEYEATARAAQDAAEAEADAMAYLLEKRKEMSEAAYAERPAQADDLGAQLDSIAQVTNERTQAIARTAGDAVVALAMTEGKATKTLAKFAGDRLIVAGIEAIGKAAIGAAFGNPAAAAQLAAGSAAIVSGRAIGGSISGGGGRGAGSAPQQVTNVTQSMHLVFDRGVRASDADAIAGAVSNAMRTGAIDSQRMR